MTNDALIAAAKALIEEWKRYANDPDLTTPHWVTPYLRALSDALPDFDGGNEEFVKVCDLLDAVLDGDDRAPAIAYLEELERTGRWSRPDSDGSSTEREEA